MSKPTQHVEEHLCRAALIDSSADSSSRCRGEQFLALYLHELVTYLNNRGGLTLMLLARMGLVRSATQTPIDVSYLADNICCFDISKRTAKCVKRSS